MKAEGKVVAVIYRTNWVSVFKCRVIAPFEFVNVLLALGNIFPVAPCSAEKRRSDDDYRDGTAFQHRDKLHSLAQLHNTHINNRAFVKRLHTTVLTPRTGSGARSEEGPRGDRLRTRPANPSHTHTHIAEVPVSRPCAFKSS